MSAAASTSVRHSQAVRATFEVNGQRAERFYDWTPGMPGYESDDVLAKIKADHDFLLQLDANTRVNIVGGQFDDAHNFIPG